MTTAFLAFKLSGPISVPSDRTTDDVLLKHDGDQSVWLETEMSGRQITRKTYAATPGQAFRFCLGITQAQRQIRGAGRVRRCGLNTPQIRSGCRLNRENGHLRYEIRLDFVPGQPLNEALSSGCLSLTEQLSIAEDVGKIVARLNAAGYRHRDLKLENLILANDGTSSLWLIDTVGVKLRVSAVKGVWQMLDRIALQWSPESWSNHHAIFRLVRNACRDLTRSQARTVIARLRKSVARRLSIAETASRPDIRRAA